MTVGAGVTINAGTATTDFASTVAGGNALTVTDSGGAVVFGSTVGSGTALSSLTTTGTTTLDSNVTTTGNQTYNSAVVLGGNDTLNSNSGSANGNIDFASTVNGNYALTVTSGSGTDTFAGIVGGGTKLASLSDTTTGAIDLNTTAVSTQGAAGQTYSGPVVLGASPTLDSLTGNGSIGFTSTIADGTSDTHALVVNAGSGNVSFDAAVGTTELASLAATGATITVGGNVTSGGNQTYSGAVTIAGTDTLNASSGNGNITFANTVDDTTANTDAACCECWHRNRHLRRHGGCYQQTSQPRRHRPDHSECQRHHRRQPDL